MNCAYFICFIFVNNKPTPKIPINHIKRLRCQLLKWDVSLLIEFTYYQ